MTVEKKSIKSEIGFIDSKEEILDVKAYDLAHEFSFLEKPTLKRVYVCTPSRVFKFVKVSYPPLLILV